MPKKFKVTFFCVIMIIKAKRYIFTSKLQILLTTYIQIFFYYLHEILIRTFKLPKVFCSRKYFY